MTISIFHLKQNGYLSGGKKSDVIVYKRGGAKIFLMTAAVTGREEQGESNHIDFFEVDKEDRDLRSRYTHVELTKTACNYGGNRYWFHCPRCGKRVGVLYWFLCRSCAGVIYSTQMESGRIRFGAAKKWAIEELEGRVWRPNYDGKPTRRYQRYLYLTEKYERTWEAYTSYIAGRF